MIAMLHFAAPPNDTATIRRQVATLDNLIAQATQRQRERLARLEGERDRLLLMLTDLDGAHDRRFVPVR